MNELYLPPISPLVLMRKQEKLYMHPDFEKNLTVDALVDSGAYVKATGQNDMDTIDDPPNIQI